MLNREKKKYYKNLDLKILNDNKMFWQKVKPLFSSKNLNNQKRIVIVEDDKITSKDKDVAEKLNDFFIKAVENLEIEPFIQRDETRIIPVSRKLKKM